MRAKVDPIVNIKFIEPEVPHSGRGTIIFILLLNSYNMYNGKHNATKQKNEKINRVTIIFIDPHTAK